MQVADFNYEDFTSEKQREADKLLLVKFELRPMKDKEASEREGRPIFKDVEFVDIRVPGKKNGSVCRPARTSDVERFPEHYRRFKERIAEPEEGTPLTEWPPVGRSTVEQLKFLNIKTVEQLAEMSDSSATQIMGGNTLKQKAKDFLSYSTDVKAKTQAKELERENQQLKDEMAELQEQMREMQSQMAALNGSEDEPEDAGQEVKPKTTKSVATKKKPVKTNPLS